VARSAEYWPVLFFEADAGRGQIRGVNQPDRQIPPGIGLDQRLKQMLVNPAQAHHAQASPELMQDPHPGHMALPAQPGKLTPSPLLRQHFDQEVQGVDRGEQTQQMHPVELRGGVFPTPPTSRTDRPAVIDEIVGHEWREQFQQFGRAGRGKG
jgi:hypothetical protein